MITITCKQCGDSRMCYPSDNRKFCSRKCFNIYWVNNVSIANIKRATGNKKYTCKECGVQFTNYKSDNSKYCSRKCSDKHTLLNKERISGSNNPMWNGGCSLYQIRPKSWRIAVFNRDNYTCQMCGVRGGELQADHIRPWYAFPDLRFDLNNGQTLCNSCHSKKTKLDMWFRRKVNKLIKAGYIIV